MTSQVTAIQVDFSADEFQLRGSLYLPVTPTNRIVIGCHGLLSDRTSPKQLELARQCVAMEMAYFVFDHRGCGESQGEFEKVTTIESRTRDLLAAVAFIQFEVDPRPRLGLFGSSMGGAVCLATAGRVKPRAIVVVAAPLKSAAIVPTSKNAEDTGHFSPSFYREKLQFDITANISAVNNLLLFHGEDDTTVPVAHGREIYSLATDPKKIIIQKNGDHRMSSPAHQREFIRAAADWYQSRI